MNATEAAKKLQEQFPGKIGEEVSFRNEVSIEVQPEALVACCQFAKNKLGFDFLTDLTGIDNHGEEPRFEVVYELFSIQRGTHLRLRTRASEEKPEVPSVSQVWRTANWHEREAYDMLGIRFTGHPDLRRILMWEGYPYFPLRKEFPLAGKSTELPDVAFTRPAPLLGGPFVTKPTNETTVEREPRAKTFEEEN